VSSKDDDVFPAEGIVPEMSHARKAAKKTSAIGNL
jgi:hypothetical protein